jgi:hypothetical protein
MKYLIISLLINLFLFSNSFSSDCKFSKIQGDKAYSYMLKSLQQDNLDNAIFYLKKAKRLLDDVALSTQYCGCNQSSLAFQDASNGAQRAINSIDVESYLYEYDSCFRDFIYACELYNKCISKNKN